MTINTAYFDAIAEQAQNCRSCADVQALADKALPQLQTLLASIADQQAILTAAQALLGISVTSPTSAVTFLQSFITDVLTPMLAAYAKTVAQATETAAAVTSTIAAIQAAADDITGCTITI